MQSFLQRLKNLGFYCGSLLGEQLRALPLYTRLGRVHGVDCLAKDTVHGSAMFLYNMDFAMEWPRPLPPTVQLVGALLPAPARPLPPAFQVGHHHLFRQLSVGQSDNRIFSSHQNWAVV